MTVTITIPDDKATYLIAGISRATGWTAGSGLTQAQWAKSKVIDWMKQTARAGQVETSRDVVTTEVDSIVLT